MHWTYNQCITTMHRRQCTPTKKALHTHFMTKFGLREAEQIKRTKSRVGGGGNDNNIGILWVFKTYLGVRTPFTVYSPDEARIYELGANNFGRIRQLCHHLNDLISRTTNRDIRKKRRRRMRRATARMRRRIRNLVDDLHRRAAKWLCETFETIIYPHYETSNMVVGKSKRRGLHSKTMRAMLTWSHFRFKQHLLHKIREYPSGCRVVLVNESYTSKTCGGCGRINHGLGKSKLFWCEQCGFRTDRDWNGARNIWLKFLTEWCNGSSRGNDDDDKEQQQQQQQ